MKIKKDLMVNMLITHPSVIDITNGLCFYGKKIFFVNTLKMSENK